VSIEKTTADHSIYHKNLQPVVYVIGDVAGKVDSPLYSILDLGPKISNLSKQTGYPITSYFTDQPLSTENYAIKWDGEWQVTYEVFRDLGIAFAVVLVLIYALIVGWFQSFITPLVIMAAIPFSLVGIMPAHALLGAFFTATSMIGFIAGAGIVVRNSIILVDFIELRLKEGMPLKEAVIDAGAVRFRPMLLTAAAVIAGSAIILTDPIFQGLAISLMAGEVASLLLSRSAVPILYYMAWRKKWETPKTPDLWIEAAEIPVSKVQSSDSEYLNKKKTLKEVN
jgi:multidrug efflux pump subunit AcrB